LDESLSVRLAPVPGAEVILKVFGMPQSAKFLQKARSSRIRYADATRKLPLQSESAHVLYSCHMLEHLDREEARQFLREAHRVLWPGGLIRLVLPDLQRRVEEYVASGDADAFVGSLCMRSRVNRTLRGRIRALVAGARDHQWMYDSRSLVKLLETNGLENATALPPGKTSVSDPLVANLDLWERCDESIYVEAVRRA
jgi:predicted SAM-dependent methyltransferase